MFDANQSSIPSIYCKPMYSIRQVGNENTELIEWVGRVGCSFRCRGLSSLAMLGVHWAVTTAVPVVRGRLIRFVRW